MKRYVKKTNDNSHTLYHPELDEHYHSIHGAHQESVHVYIAMGLEAHQKNSALRVFEMGFGTGLNVLLAQEFAEKHQRPIAFTSVEKFPLPLDISGQLNFGKTAQSADIYQKLHTAPWEQPIKISPYFTLTKIAADVMDVVLTSSFDVVFYDAFGPRVQPELWELPIFEKLYGLMAPGGILVTYCAKGQVRRNMQAAGFRVERLPGPPGKREMLRAIKEG